MRIATRTTLTALLLGTAMLAHYPASAEDATPETGAEAEAAAPYSAEELDTLMAPIALYPDALLAQVLMATTYPVDVLKADRFLTKNAGLDDKARSALAADEEWADPVRELTAGFPELISRMAEHMDWTEQTGNAVLASTNDVLDSLQRLRAQASLNGYLVDNEAMTVDEDADSGNITISSKDPEVVYVPQYTETVYTQPAPATPVYVTNDDNWDDLLVTGAVVWGSAIILDEIFDDDDWDGGRDHWYGGGYGGGNGNGNSIDWDGDINVDNGINIGNGNGNGIGNGNGNGIGNRPGEAGELHRPTTLPGKLGDVDSDRLRDRKDGTFKPSEASREEAREKIAKSKSTKEGVSTLPAATGKRDLGTVKDGKKPEVKLPDRTKDKPKVDRKPEVSSDKMAKPKKPTRPNGGSTKVAKTKAPPVYMPSTGNRGNAASLRGNKSLKGNR